MSPTPSSIISFNSFRSEAAEWKRFTTKLALVLIGPLAAALLLCVLICWSAGEFVPDGVAADRQRADPRVIWFAHNDRDAVHFKMLRVAQEKPEILIMGQSRMSQFRAPMFAPYSFYNLSRVSWPINTLAPMLEHLPAGYTPRVILFNLDFYLFNSGYDSAHASASPRYESNDLLLHLRSLHACINIFGADPHYLFTKPPFPTIGLEAFTRGHGFRLDGSELWRSELEHSAGRDANLAAHANWNLEPLNYFPGDAVDRQELAELGTFADLARQRGIKLIGIQMPLYAPVGQAMENSDRFKIVRRMHDLIASGYFDRLGILTFDYLDFPPYSTDYRCFQDPAHSTEAVSAAVLLQIARSPRGQAILPQLDTLALQQKLDAYEKAGRPEHLY